METRTYTIQATHHFGSLELRYPQGDLGDGVTAHQLHDLRCRGELAVHADVRQLQVL